MSKISSAEAREHLPELLNQAAYSQKRLVVHRRGKPLAAIISIDDLRLLEALEDADDVRVAKQRLKEPTVSFEALKKKLKL